MAFYDLILVCCVIIGSKFFDEYYLSMEYIHSFSGFSPNTLLSIEIHILSVIELNIRIGEKEYLEAADTLKSRDKKI